MYRYVITRWLRRVGLGLLLAFTGLWLWMQLSASPLPGVRLDGQALGDGNPTRLLRERYQAWRQTKLVIHTGPYVARATRETLGAARDPEQALAKLVEVGRSGNPLIDVPTFFRALRGGVDVAWPVQVDQTRLLEFVRKLRHRMERPPIAGTTGRDGKVIEGIPGLTINALSAVSMLKDALRRDELELRLHARQIPPPVPVSFESLSTSAQFGHVMATFSSEYALHGRSEGRAANVELAATKLDGLELAPGDTFSYNEVVGERSLARGFQVAPELANMMVVDGVGGGVCQTAATLHAAAFLGALEVVEYRPHSRPTRYVPTGLDTMVSWPDKDLKLRNPYPFPVRIRVSMQPRGTITVSLLGATPAHPVDWAADVVETTPAGERQVEDEGLALGQREVKQLPIDGVVIKRTRTIYLPTGPQTEERTIRYPPTPKIIAVGAF